MPQIADRKSMARYICVDKGATHPALQREELPKHMAIYADAPDIIGLKQNPTKRASL